MVSSFGPYISCWDEQNINLRALIYKANSGVRKSVQIHTLRNRYEQDARPDMYYVMDDASIQSYVHDAVAIVRHRRREYKFVIFTKHHQDLPVNGALSRLMGRDWEGDIVVMKKGVLKDRLVNLVSKEDCVLANFAVKRYTAQIQRRREFWVPKAPLTFIKP